MNKSIWQPIGIPRLQNLPPSIMIMFSFLLGYIVLFMPWIYVTFQPIANISHEQNQFIYVRNNQESPSVDNCVVSQVEWNSGFTQKMFEISKFLRYLLRFVPVYLWLHYLGKRVNVTPVSLTIFFLAVLSLIIVSTIISLQIFPDEVVCDPIPMIRIVNISLYLPTILLWLLSIGFGILSLYQTGRVQQLREN